MSNAIAGSLRELPNRSHVVTIGSFDGVHRGHRHLIDQVTSTARSRGVAALAITFDPLPAEVLRPDLAPPRLCSTDERTRQMLRAGLDCVVVLTFSNEMANQSAEAFLQELHHYARPTDIIVGEDFAFGHKRQGTPAFLEERASNYGYQLQVIPRLNPDANREWSSSSVRKALAESGDVSGASHVLGRPFRLTGTVENGDNRGRTLGYPTANLNLPANQIIPADGIYAGFATIDRAASDTAWPSLVYIGTRPTFGSSNRVVEAFLLDFEGDLYDSEIAVDFLQRIRGDRAFDSADELVEQMRQDEEAGRRLFAELSRDARAQNNASS